MQHAAGRSQSLSGRPSPWSCRSWFAVALGVAFVLHFPLYSHLRKALVTDHGDWLSIYNIAEFSWRTGELQADEAEPIVRTQRYPPITRPLIMLLAAVPKPVSAVLSFVLFAALYGWSAWRVAEVFLSKAGVFDTAGARYASTPSDLGVGRYKTPPSGTAVGRFGATSDPRVAACGEKPSIATAALLLLALVLPYLWADLTAGNVTSVLLASVTAAFVWERRGRPLRAGLALSIGIMLKLIPLICLLYFLMRRRWRVGWGVLAGLLFIGLLPTLAIFGPQRTWDYHRWWYQHEFIKFTPLQTIDHPVECTYQNQAVVRTLVRLLTHTNAGPSDRPFFLTIAEPPRIAIKTVYIGVMGASMAGLLWTLWRTRRDDGTAEDAAPGDAPAIDASATSGGAYALCVGSMLWFSPWVGSYYFTLMLWPAAAVLAACLHPGRMGGASAARRGGRLAGMALLIWIASGGALASQLLRALGCNMWAAALLLSAAARTSAPRHPESARH